METMTSTYTPLARRIRQAAQFVGDYFNDEVNLSIRFSPSTHLGQQLTRTDSPESVPISYPRIPLEQTRPSTVCPRPFVLVAPPLWSFAESLPPFGDYRQYPRSPLARMVDD